MELSEIRRINLPTAKFASVLALVIRDTMDHGGQLREAHVKEVVELLK